MGLSHRPLGPRSCRLGRPPGTTHRHRHQVVKRQRGTSGSTSPPPSLRSTTAQGQTCACCCRDRRDQVASAPGSAAWQTCVHHHRCHHRRRPRRVRTHHSGSRLMVEVATKSSRLWRPLRALLQSQQGCWPAARHCGRRVSPRAVRQAWRVLRGWAHGRATACSRR